jgi:beta-lactamase class A
VEDGPAFRAGLNNSVTARSLGALLHAIADGRAASAVSCGHMLRILLAQRFRSAIPAGLPRRTRVAHKTGWITALHHDAAIVYLANRPRYVLVVLTRGVASLQESAALIADLTRIIHEDRFPPPPPR